MNIDVNTRAATAHSQAKLHLQGIIRGAVSGSGLTLRWAGSTRQSGTASATSISAHSSSGVDGSVSAMLAVRLAAEMREVSQCQQHDWHDQQGGEGPSIMASSVADTTISQSVMQRCSCLAITCSTPTNTTASRPSATSVLVQHQVAQVLRQQSQHSHDSVCLPLPQQLHVG